MKTKQINTKVIALWEDKFPDNADEFMPLVYPPLKPMGILFIGLNPSFSDRGFLTILADTPYANSLPREFYHWRNRSSFDLVKAIAIEGEARKKHPFFAKFQEFSNYMGIPWEHIDLFFYRRTKQNEFRSVIYKNDKVTEFSLKQLELSKTLIQAAKPQIIVVANALAAQIFEKEFEPRFDEELGCHVMALNEQYVPVFLASMLTGQRAIDTYSYQRLKWHVKYVLRRTSRKELSVMLKADSF